MLLAMCDDIREEEFMKRGPAVVRIEDGAFGDASKAMAADVRRVIWNKMRHFRLSSRKPKIKNGILEYLVEC